MNSFTYTKTFEIECGADTCASHPGVFCKQLGAKKFGMQPWCLLFNEELFETPTGWVARCSTCIEHELKFTSRTPS